MKKELKDMIGKLPDNWQTMSPEEKMGIVFRKFELIQAGKDMYKLELRFTKELHDGYGAWLVITPSAIPDDEDSEGCTYFALTHPVPKGKFDIKQFPEYLHEIIKNKAYDDWDTKKKDYNMLHPESADGTFAETAERMYFMLDLLTCGYELTDAESYEEEHRDLYPVDEGGDDDDDDFMMQ